MSVEVGYVGNYGAQQFVGRRTRRQHQQPDARRVPERVPATSGRPFFAGPGRRRPSAATAERTAGRRASTFFCNCGHNWYDSIQTRFNRRFKDGYSVPDELHVQKAKQEEGGDYFFYDREPEQGPDRAGIARTPSTWSCVYELPFGTGKKWGNGLGRVDQRHRSAAGSSTRRRRSRAALPFEVNYAGAGSDRDVGPNRPNVTGDIKINGGRDKYFDTTPIGVVRTARTRGRRSARSAT